MKKYIVLLLTIITLFPFSVRAEEIENIEMIENESTEIIEDSELGTNEIVTENKIIVTLEECIDGDTAKFRTQEDEIIKARMLAIDTPETVHPTIDEEPFGKEASDYTCTMLTLANEIVIEYDPDSKEEDNYGRKLVWIFTDGALLQNSLVSKGYAEVAYLYGDYKYTSTLSETEKEAKRNKLGIWSIDDTVEEEKTEEKEEASNSFIDKLIDKLFAKIFDCIDCMLEKLLTFIEEML